MLKNFVRKRMGRRMLSLLLCAVFMSALLPALPALALGPIDYGDLTPEQPDLVITGQDIIAGGVYSASNISNEKSYTMAELKGMSSITHTRVYSSINSSSSKRFYIGEGLDVAGLLAMSGYTVDSGGTLTLISSDSTPRSVEFSSTVPLNTGRQYYPNLGEISGEDDGAVPISALLAWKHDNSTAPATPSLPSADLPLRLLVGQMTVGDVNNGLYNQNNAVIQAGSAITETALTVDGTDYTRAELLMMPRAEWTHTYVNSSSTTVTTRVRGVPLAYLLEDADDGDFITFTTADGFSTDASGMTKAELVSLNAVLVYETRNTADTAWDGYYRQTGSYPAAYIRLYVDGISPAHAVTDVDVDASGSSTPAIAITTQPAASTSLTAGSITGSLNVAASLRYGDSSTLKYEWFSNTTSSNTGGTALNTTTYPSAASASFTIPTALAAGTYYYYCIVSTADDSLSRASNVATVTVATSGSGGGGNNQTEQYLSFGGATPNDYDFCIVGAVPKPAYFTMDGLKACGATVRTDVSYFWINSSLSTDTDIFTGVYMEDLLVNVMGLSRSATGSINVADTQSSRPLALNFNLDTSANGVFGTAIDGTKMMLAWYGTEGRLERDPIDFSLPRLIVGQNAADHTNRGNWVTGIDTITVSVTTVDNPGANRPSTGGTTGGNTETDGDENGDDVADENVTATIEVEVTVTDGVAAATSSADDISGALDALNEEATSDNAVKNLVIDATTDEDTEKTVFTLMQDALDILTEDGHTNVELQTDQGNITLSAELLNFLSDNFNGALVITIEAADDAAIEEGLLAEVTITITVGSTEVTDFGGIIMRTDIPFTPEETMPEEGLICYYITDDGQRIVLKLAAFNPDSHSMRLGLLHLSTYAIGSNPVTFSDIQGHWGQTDIQFLASRGIVNGRTANTFEPGGTVTRAEFVKMLAESVDGITVPAGGGSGFTDVPNGAWYAGYVGWAVGLGIVQGYEDETFRPNGLITRQEMAVMLERYIRSMGFDLRVVHGAAEYSDAAQIGGFATGAVRAVQQYGLMSGANGAFRPGDTATRAEAARVMRTYIEAVLG